MMADDDRSPDRSDGRSEGQLPPEARPASAVADPALLEQQAVLDSGGTPGIPGAPGTLVAADAADTAETGRRDHGPSWFQIIWASKKARVGIVLLGLYLLVALCAPLIAPYRGNDTTFAPVLLPGAEHWFGTTTQGADIFSQLIWGTRVSLIVGLFGGLFATVVGLLVGLTAGYLEGTWVDDVLSLITNVALVVPTLPLIITLMAYSEVRSIWFTIFIIGIIS